MKVCTYKLFWCQHTIVCLMIWKWFKHHYVSSTEETFLRDFLAFLKHLKNLEEMFPSSELLVVYASWTTSCIDTVSKGQYYLKRQNYKQYMWFRFRSDSITNRYELGATCLLGTLPILKSWHINSSYLVNLDAKHTRFHHMTYLELSFLRIIPMIVTQVNLWPFDDGWMWQSTHFFRNSEA